MSYPAAPNWMSADPGSAWFIHAVSGQSSSICASTGWDSLVDLQVELQNRLSNTPLQTYDGSTVDGSIIQQNDGVSARGWSTDLLRALYAVAQAAGASQQYLAAIQSDGQNGFGSISTYTLQTGIWIGRGYYSGVVQGTSQTGYGVGSPAEIQIPTGTTYPSMNFPPPIPTTGIGGGVGGGAICSVAPSNIASLVSIDQNFVPFQFNVWVVLGVAAAAVTAVAIMARDVPVVTAKGEVVRGSRVAGARQNPRKRRAVVKSRRKRR